MFADVQHSSLFTPLLLWNSKFFKVQMEQYVLDTNAGKHLKLPQISN
jgi:hypothetical protein